jgi:uncharacterized iron-regulated membrane protein
MVDAPPVGLAAPGRVADHLWTGVGLALYVAMLSLTGSVLVYRYELMHAFAAAADDRGDPFPAWQRAVVWVASPHDDLLLGRDRRALDGVGSIVVTLLVVRGAIIWWPACAAGAAR